MIFSMSSTFKQWGNAARAKSTLGLGLLLFSLLYYLVFNRHVGHVILFGDSIHYDHSASLLLSMHVYSYWSWGPAAQVTPGYPFFLAFCYAVGHLFSPSQQFGFHTAIFIQSLLAAFNVLLVYQLARQFLRKWWSLLPALLWLIYPPTASASRLLLTETLYVFVLLLFTIQFIRMLRVPSLRNYILSGFLLALTVLVRPTVFPLILAPVCLLFQKDIRATWKAYVRPYLAYLVTFAVCMLPWWIRNYYDFHRLILTSDDAGNPLLFGSDPNFQTDVTLANGLTPGQQESLAKQRIIEGFSHHPFSTLRWYTLDKLHLLFGTEWYEGSMGYGLLHRLMSGISHLQWVWVILGFVGLLLGLRHSLFRWITVLVVFLILLQLPFIPINRYVFPIMPFFMLGTAFLCEQFVKRYHRPTLDS
jgi:4-amino-4-deoxy-L-arabinose transferase-like glycosyltransferase